MNNRLVQIRKSLNLSQKNFGEKLNIKQTTISDMERGQCNITERTINNICLIFHVSEKWLRFGEGDMFIEIDKKHNEFFEIFDKLSPPLQEFLLVIAEDLLSLQHKL